MSSTCAAGAENIMLLPCNSRMRAMQHGFYARGYYYERQDRACVTNKAIDALWQNDLH